MAGDEERKEREAETAAGPAWSGLISQTVKELVGVIGDSSKQVAAAAERFAGESLHVLDEFAGKAEHSVTASRDMADAARRAAQDAREAAESAGAAVAEAGQRVLQEASDSLQAALAESRRALEDTERLRGELQTRLQAALDKIETSLRASREAAEAAQRAAEEAKRAAASAASRAVAEDGCGLEAAGEQLVEAAGAAPSAEASAPPAEQVQVSVVGGGEPLLGGRVLLRLEPIADFDGLLRLDDALSRLQSVGSIALSDYADDSATFRLELRQAQTPEQLCGDLSRSAGLRLRVETAAPGLVCLRIE